MKKSLFAILIAATALVPAAAEAQDRHGHGGGGDRGGGGRQWSQPQQRGSAPQMQRPDYSNARRGTPQAYAPRPQAPQAASQARPQWQGGARPQWQGGERPQWRGEDRSRVQIQPQQRQPDRQWSGRPQGQPDRRWDGRRPDGQPDRRWNGRPDGRQDWRNDQRRGEPNRQWDRDRSRPEQFRQDRRFGDWRDNNRYRNDLNDRRSWSRDWRRDGRYNWSDYRRYNRNLYHLPRYYAPHGWDYGYRRFSIGITIGSMLFGPDYWIDDPFYYRLPPAYGPYRWVRYYNDALLVDLRTGLVVDVIYDIFW